MLWPRKENTAIEGKVSNGAMCNHNLRGRELSNVRLGWDASIIDPGKRCATKARSSSGIDEVAKRGKANLGPQ